MKLKELKEFINKLPEEMDDREVILAKDAEGNAYSPLTGISSDCIYIPETTWFGDVYYTDNSAEDNCMEEAEWNELKNNEELKCILLDPVN